MDNLTNEVDVRSITLQHFLEIERKRLIQFEAYWKKNGEQNPEMFPSQMLSGDWDEMLLFFDNDN
ncbi:hypothetical protein [Photobacterium kishitanii]|uniref:Uncharacterized protein n=1 Tax=Photobacterium kishitanii TaxID=318456 RepID=A0A2T3KLH3_9GAMM|nr:hypothetical protein [Photobacterium kishitanii]PSV00509.1 hypothetical protein C9J27_05080 [Photobacterium kishitanii]